MGVFAQAAGAQFYTEPLPGDGGVNTGLLALGNPYRCASDCGGSPGPSRRHHRHPPKAPTVTASQRAQLRYTPVPTVRQADEQKAIQTLADDQGNGDPGPIQAGYATLVSDIDHGISAEPGWHVNNVGDDCAYTLLLTYDYYNNTSTPTAGDQKVRRLVADSLASSRAVRRLSSARKQTAADAIEFDFIFYTIPVATARANGDTAALADALTSLRTWAKRTYGVDLTKIRVTSRGLVKR